MVVGTTLMKLDGNPYFSPSFPRGGLAATFAIEVSHYQGLTNFTVIVEHRDEHDTTFATLGTFTAITADGHSELDLTGCKQILRLQYNLNGGSASNGDGVHFVMQAPSWRPY